MLKDENYINEFKSFINGDSYPCVGAKAALVKEQLEFIVIPHMACPADDRKILHFLYSFIENYRKTENLYYTAVVIFKEPFQITEEDFENLLWKRLQSISDLDAVKYTYDPRVKINPQEEHFSFSIMEEALFINGMHPASCRASRRFKYPCLVINPHQQFEQLKEKNQYFKMRETVRSKDLDYCGSPNIMARDFFHESEAFQYSGKEYDRSWKCPLRINHKEK